jgi:hypothetical protein
MAIANGRDIELHDLPAGGHQVLDEGVLLLPGYHLVVGIGHDEDPGRSIAHGIERSDPLSGSRTPGMAPVPR